jgi:cytochrome c556
MIHSKVWRAAGVAVLLAGIAQVSLAQSPTPAERAIDYRKAVFKVIAGNFGPLAQNAQGKLELPAGAANKYAQRLAAVADFPRDAFPDISREGDTKARPEIWTDKAEFEKLLNDLGTTAKALAAVTAKADAKPDDFKAAVGAVGNACKACHDKVRAK